MVNMYVKKKMMTFCGMKKGSNWWESSRSKTWRMEERKGKRWEREREGKWFTSFHLRIWDLIWISFSRYNTKNLWNRDCVGWDRPICFFSFFSISFTFPLVSFSFHSPPADFRWWCMVSISSPFIHFLENLVSWSTWSGHDLFFQTTDTKAYRSFEPESESTDKHSFQQLMS